MQKIEMEGTYRKAAGKGPARQLRFRGAIPAILYRKGSSVPMAVKAKDMDRILRAGGRNFLITLSMVEGENAPGTKETRLAILKEMQRDPLTGHIVHIDFFEIAMNEPIRVHVPVEIAGIASGVKAGGILQYSLRDMEIQCLPSMIPDTIRVDVSSLEIGDVIHVRDLVVQEGMKIITAPDRGVVSVVPPISETKMEAMLATAPKETKEPEVVGRKEKEGEETKDAGPGAGKTKDAGKAKDTGKTKEKEKK